MTILPSPLFNVLVLLLFLIRCGVASFKDDCLNERDSQTKSTFIDGSCLAVDTMQLLSRPDAQQKCLDPSQHKQLATIFDQTKLSHIAALLDLSNGVWTALLLNSNNETVWLNKKSDKNISITSPSWAPGFPDPTKGAGILLRFDGLVNAQLDSEHPFLCESFETSVQVRFTGVRKSNVPEAVLSTSTVADRHDCGISCTDDPKCRAYAYSASSSECQLLWQAQGSMTPEKSAEHLLMNRVKAEADCLAASDCLSDADLPKILLVTHDGVVSFESYFPAQSNLNAVLQNTTQERLNPVALILNGKVVVTAHEHNKESDKLALARETIIYDPKTNAVSSAGPTVEARHAPAAAVLDQAIVMCGGISSTGTELTNCERFSTGVWSLMTATLNVGRHAFAMANLHNKLYAVGGWNGNYVSQVERYDLTSDAWATLTDPLPFPRHSPEVTVFQDQLVVCGGYSGTFHDTCHTFSDLTDHWSPLLGVMSQPRLKPTLAAFRGYIFAFGGASWPTDDSSVEMFDPETGWSLATDTIQAKFSDALVV